MTDRWGPDGPPKDAYSRVTRDLAQVTQGFADYLDDLPTRLTAEFDCEVRPVSSAELARVSRDHAANDLEYAVEPGDPAAATLLIARWTFEGGATATIGFGRAVTAQIPMCFCDACDEDSPSLVDQAEEYIAAVSDGSYEFRRPYENRTGEPLDGGGPWLEQGYRSAGGSHAGASAGVRGDLFEVEWAPWRRRG